MQEKSNQIRPDPWQLKNWRD